MRKRPSAAGSAAPLTLTAAPPPAGHLPILAAALLAALVHAPAIQFGLTRTDDKVLLNDDATFLQDAANIPRTLSRPFFPLPSRGETYYRPLVTTTFILDAQWAGLVPQVFHATNVILHMIATALVGLLLLRFGFPTTLAAAGAALFGVHPALTEAVAWIPGRCDLLLGVGFLVAAHGLVSLRDGSRKGLILHLTGLTLALFSKEAAVATPAAFALLWIIPEWRPTLRTKPLWIGWATVFAVYLACRSTLPDVTTGEPLAQRLTTATAHFPVLLMQLGKLVVPHPLAVLAYAPDTPWIPGAVVVAALLALTRLVAIPALYIWALAVAAVFILPSLPVSDFLILENRLYVPAVALVIAVAASLRTLWPRPTSTVPVALTVAAFSVLTVIYGQNFRDPSTFTAQAIRTSPTLGLAHLNRGIVHHLDGDLTTAEGEYEEARRLDPGLSVTHNNLGLIYMNRGDMASAESAFRRELTLNPRYDTAHYNLGLVLARTGRLDHAVASWRTAVEINPANEAARADLARAEQQGIGRGSLTPVNLDTVPPDVVVKLYRGALAREPGNEAIRSAYRAFCEARGMACD